MARVNTRGLKQISPDFAPNVGNMGEIYKYGRETSTISRSKHLLKESYHVLLIVICKFRLVNEKIQDKMNLIFLDYTL